MKSFNKYISETHPDPDTLYGKTEKGWDEFIKLGEGYAETIAMEYSTYVLGCLAQGVEPFSFYGYKHLLDHVADDK